MYVVLCDIIFFYLNFGDQTGCKKTFSCEYSDYFIYVVTYVKAKDAYNLDNVQAKRTHVIT